MMRLTENKIILVTRKTRLDDLIQKFNTREQARFYIEHQQSDFQAYQEEDASYKSAVKTARQILSGLGRLQVLDRSYLPGFIFGKHDFVVVLGQDGLVANVLKYLESQPLLAVNPDPVRYEGILLPFETDDIAPVLQEVFEHKRKISEITMARVELNNGQYLYGVNDIFIGPKTHTSARYSIQIGDKKEDHSSSGIIVSTGLGSSGWLRSVFAGASGISSGATGSNITIGGDKNFTWDSDFLYFSVREPWPSNTSSADVTFGKITQQTPLNLLSAMPENGTIFSDGIEADCLEFNSGTHATISVAQKKGRLVI